VDQDAGNNCPQTDRPGSNVDYYCSFALLNITVRNWIGVGPKITERQVSDKGSQLFVLCLIRHEPVQFMQGKRKGLPRWSFFLLCVVFVAYFIK